MPQEFDGDLVEAVFWGADLRRAHFRDVDLTGARIDHAWFVDVEIDALVDRVVVNGVDITDYVNERDPWYPLRAMVRAADPPGMQAAWAAFEAEWSTTVAQARDLPAGQEHESVDGEWSFVQTIRHVVFAMDKWFTNPVLGVPFAPMGLPNIGSIDFPFPGLDLDASPSLDDALAVRTDRVDRFRTYLATFDPGELPRSIDILENGPSSLRDCIGTVLEEEFWHLRYARRDLDRLRGPRPRQR